MKLRPLKRLRIEYARKARSVDLLWPQVGKIVEKQTLTIVEQIRQTKTTSTTRRWDLLKNGWLPYLFNLQFKNTTENHNNMLVALYSGKKILSIFRSLKFSPISFISNKSSRRKQIWYRLGQSIRNKATTHTSVINSYLSHLRHIKTALIKDVRQPNFKFRLR